MIDPITLAASLRDILEEEFEALRARDLDHFERLQPGKSSLLERLAAAVDASRATTTAPDASLAPEFQSIILQCRDAHRRNQTLIQHQLAAIRGTLQALTAGGATDSVEVYDRLGTVRSRLRGRGYSDA